MAVAGVEELVGLGLLVGDGGLGSGDEVAGEDIFFWHRLRSHSPRKQFCQQPGEAEGVKLFDQLWIDRVQLGRDVKQFGRFRHNRRDV